MHNVQHSIRILKQNRLIYRLKSGTDDQEVNWGLKVSRNMPWHGEGQVDAARNGPWTTINKVNGKSGFM